MQYVVIIAQKRSYFLSCLTKEKIEVYRPKKALNFSFFEKQKEYDMDLKEPPTKGKTDTKKNI